MYVTPPDSCWKMRWGGEEVGSAGQKLKPPPPPLIPHPRMALGDAAPCLARLMVHAVAMVGQERSGKRWNLC